MKFLEYFFPASSPSLPNPAAIWVPMFLKAPLTNLLPALKAKIAVRVFAQPVLRGSNASVILLTVVNKFVNKSTAPLIILALAIPVVNCSQHY